MKTKQPSACEKFISNKRVCPGDRVKNLRSGVHPFKPVFDLFTRGKDNVTILLRLRIPMSKIIALREVWAANPGADPRELTRLAEGAGNYNEK